tara:strand:- start:793 stop:1233 length:441 start_codon:yes stop_codon:yes gene_type:complete
MKINKFISIGSDHAGYDLKEEIVHYLKNNNYHVYDKGTFSNESTDYPEFGHKVGQSIVDGETNKGIVICGSGIGISIAANKIKGIRAALCSSKKHARMSRLHNDSNVLALGSRMEGADNFLEIVRVWLNTDFEGGRHENRINKIEI